MASTALLTYSFAHSSVRMIYLTFFLSKTSDKWGHICSIGLIRRHFISAWSIFRKSDRTTDTVHNFIVKSVVSINVKHNLGPYAMSITRINQPCISVQCYAFQRNVVFRPEAGSYVWKGNRGNTACSSCTICRAAYSVNMNSFIVSNTMGVLFSGS